MLIPYLKGMEAFEIDVIRLIKGITFNNRTNSFQRDLGSYLRPFRNSSKCFVKADKTKNIYGLDKPVLDNLLLSNITSTYKITNPATYNNINNEARELAVGLKIEDRMEYLIPHAPHINLI